MSTGIKKAKAPKGATNAAEKVALKAVATTSKPKVGDQVAEPTGKRKASTASLKVAAKPAAKKTPPSAKTRSRAAPAGLKLVKTASRGGRPGSTSEALPKPLNDKVRIFQIYYRPEQREYLDPAFEPYNNEGDNSPLLEFNVFRKLMNSDLVKGADLWGALSWKFREKTGLTGEQLRQVIAANPGYDVYYCNPFPELEGLYHNMWLQGETTHPNFLILCNEFFRAAGLDHGDLTRMLPSGQFAASNYFVASPAFWSGYASFVSQAIDRAEEKMSDTGLAMLYSKAADSRSLHAGASYMPFIIERLFGVYLHRDQGRYRVYKYSCTLPESKVNIHTRLLRQMKDVAYNTRSLWLATCWVNYRNLYMAQSYGNAWCSRHLNSITPVRVHF